MENLAPQKSAVIALIGRPSSGKSTLINALTGHRISIVAPSPQTTRNTIRGIVTEKRGQLVILDTPGMHQSEKKLNNRLVGLVKSTLDECDLILYVVDQTREMGTEEENLVKIIKTSGKKTIVCLNKEDAEKTGTEYVSLMQESLTPCAIIKVSALNEQGLEKLKDSLFAHSPEGELLYPEEFYTDQSPEFRASEVIREIAINRVLKELPHVIYVEISDFEERQKKDAYWIRAFLIVESESQKGIMIGHKASMIKAIRQESEKRLSEVFERKIFLDLMVKVSPKWRQRDGVLNRLIY